MSVTSVAQEIVEIDGLFDAAMRTEGKYRGFLESQARNRLKRLAIDAQSKLSWSTSTDALRNSGALR